MTARELPLNSTRAVVPDHQLLTDLLFATAEGHQHLCPRQVLGVRLALRGLRALGFVDERGLPRFLNDSKRLLTIVETDGCGSDGIAMATDCSVGRRTLRVLDYGKVAATLIDTQTESAIRVAPSAASRTIAKMYTPEAESTWHAYLEAYQIIPDDELIKVQKVRLTRTIKDILSKPGARRTCSMCGEEIINEREVVRAGLFFCRSCAGDSYYKPE